MLKDASPGCNPMSSWNYLYYLYKNRAWMNNKNEITKICCAFV